MAKVYRGQCTLCDYVTPNVPYSRRARLRALKYLREHVCRPAPVVLTPQRCACCGHEFLLLVDDSNLCIGCDARLYPAAG